jgi:hypothetical protein
MLFSRAVLFVSALAAIGCGNSMPPADAGTDSGSGSDASTMMMMPEGGMMIGTDGGGTNDGVCGAMVKSCICACGMNGQCQTQCINANMMCGQCVAQAQIGCCPTEAQALAACIRAAQMESDAGPACMDQACVLMRCSAEGMALSTCFQTAQQEPACRTMLAGCFGDFPIACR